MRLRIPAWLFAFCALLCACGGGGGGGGATTPSVPSITSTPTPAPTPAPGLPTSVTAGANLGTTAATATFATIAGGYGGGILFPAASAGAGTAALVLSSTNPVAGAALSASARLPKAIGGSLDPLVYVTLTTTATVTFANWPLFTFVLPSGITLPAGAAYYLGYNPGDTAGNWSTLSNVYSANGNGITFSPVGPVTFTAGVTYAFSLFATAQVLVPATPSPSPSPARTASPALSPSPSPSPVSSSPANSAFTCPATGTLQSIARSGGSTEATRRMAWRRYGSNAPSATTLLAVAYDRSRAVASATQIASREQSLGLGLVRTYDYATQGISLRVVSVPTAALAQTEAALRAQAGVRSVSVTGGRRYRTTANAVYTNDPYFQGFAPNFEVAPYATSSSVPGQWDMHAIGLEHAYGYSQAGGTYTQNAAALGSSSIKIAIIDTGEDASHPDLSGKVAYQHCFITNAAGTAQSTGSFSIDEDGHGTDVSGIAAAAAGNGVGFSGAGGKAVIYAYRVFPTPDDNCASDGSNDPQCSADTADIASAINDSVAQGVNIISMSLGGGACNGGADEDAVEGSAVANALSHNVIVIAASGNGGSSSVSAPGCIAGVIAAGATSLDDGLTTGTTGHYTSTRTSTASPANVVEYVTSYTQFGIPGANLHSAAAWGIVAPGGDPGNGNDANNLHWIENIWTTTPFAGFAGDNNFTGECTNDYPNGTLTTSPDCRTLIAGTSMATPHVAGAAALILAVAPQYGTPAMMKQLLCQTADDLSDSHQGCGRLNVYRAMAVAIGDTSRP